MADTPRTRAALQTLFADNVTGQISPQDLRDFLVTSLPAEFVNEYDFWNEPLEAQLTTDKTTRGRHLYSQIVSSTLANGMSFGQIYHQNASGVWSTANVSTSTANGPRMGVAADSYAINVSTAKLLKWGIVYDSAMSARTASAVGLPLYLQSDIDNSVSVTATTNSTKVVGCVLPSGIGQSTAVGSGKWFFGNFDWAVKG